MAHDTTRRFAGVTSPNTTQVPDQYLDELLSVLSGAELKVLLYITRRTFGFKKDRDAISLSQMLHGIVTRDGRRLDHGVGLSKKTLLAAISSLKAQNIILTERRRSAQRGDEPTVYRLNIVTPGPSEPVDPVGEKFPQGGGGEMPPRGRGKNSPTQQTGEQHTAGQQTASSIFTTSNGTRRSNGERPPALPEPVLFTVTEFSAEFGDAPHTRANCTRAARLFTASGLSASAFCRTLYEARSVTRDEINRRRLSGSGTPVHNAIAYFFAVVEDLLGLRPRSMAGPAARAEEAT